MPTAQMSSGPRAATEYKALSSALWLGLGTMLKADTQIGVLVGVVGPDRPICEARGSRPDSRPLRAACNGLLADSRVGREEPASAITGERGGTPAIATPEVNT